MKKYLLLVLVVFVILFIVLKKEETVMVDLSNYTLEEVKSFVKNNDIQLLVIEQNNYEKKGKIIHQSIKSGSSIKKNDKLSITISKGPINNTVYKEYKVNELGRIPIMMYHGIANLKNEDTAYNGGNIDKDGYNRTTEAFRSDLQMYYDNGYRMIRLSDYVDGIISTELGYSPIILTFDDGNENNLRVTGKDENGNLIIDSNSAVGILEEFKKKYPDYNVTATFFVNDNLFNQKKYNEDILKWLISNGYDIGNHTKGHVNFTNINTKQTETAVGYIYELLNTIIPNKYVNIVALPFGSPYKTTHENFKYILNGKYNKEYITKSTLRVGWEADYSPFSNLFNKSFIKRIRAWDNNGIDFDIKYNFNLLEKNRYISDGDINTIVYSKELTTFNNKIIDKKIISY